MVGVFQFDGFAAGKELGGDELLIPGQGSRSALPANQGIIAVIFFDPHPAFYRHVHHCGGKGLVVIPHAADETHPRRRKTGGRGVQRDDGAAGRVPSHPEPDPVIERQEHGQPDEPDGRGRIILKEEAHLLLAGGLAHHALGPGHRYGQAFPGGQGPGGLEDNEVVAGGYGKIVAPVSLVTGVGRRLEDPGPGGQLDIGLGPVDGEGPAVAGDIPVELVKVLEKSQFPVDPVPDGVGVDPGPEKHVFLADADLDPVGGALGLIGFGPVVPQDLFHLKAHPDGVAQPVRVGGGKIPDDAPLDLLAGSLDRDILGDGHGGVGMDLDEALEIEDALGLGQGRAGPRPGGPGS